jgi:NAD(P)-dependent dehydrogenase (short-subunit alcohol dehydrogenase family)
MTGKKLALSLGAAGVGSWLALRVLRSRLAHDLRDKVVLVTGGSRGLGLVLARHLVQEGARIAICARDQEELDRAFRDLADRGARVLAVPCDLTERAQVHLMIEEVGRRLGPIDVLINNASIISVGPLETMTLEDFQEAMQYNFWTAVYTILAVLPQMRRRGSGRIVNITSIGGKVSVPHLLPYGASKFALVGLSEGLRSELAGTGIVVTTVCPGLMRTGSPRHAFFKGQHRAEYAWFALGDSLPLASMSADRAARQIIAACKNGTTEDFEPARRDHPRDEHGDLWLRPSSLRWLHSDPAAWRYPRSRVHGGSSRDRPRGKAIEDG